MVQRQGQVRQGVSELLTASVGSAQATRAASHTVAYVWFRHACSRTCWLVSHLARCAAQAASVRPHRPSRSVLTLLDPDEDEDCLMFSVSGFFSSVAMLLSSCRATPLTLCCDPQRLQASGRCSQMRELRSLGCLRGFQRRTSGSAAKGVGVESEAGRSGGRALTWRVGAARISPLALAALLK